MPGSASGGNDAAVVCVLVDVQALHAVDGADLVPHQEVPVAPLVASGERLAIDLVWADAQSWTVGYVACIVAAQVELGGLGVAQFSEDGAYYFSQCKATIGIPFLSR